ncbi:MAG TPA: response regulator [Candidatus Binataceae bacterium]|nr:response regulator [Candidatus Binataceae bacterium]
MSEVSSPLISTSTDEQVAFLKSILESSTEYSIVAKDLDGTILAWNEGARRIYGYGAKDIIGQNASLLHHPEDVAQGKRRAILDEVRRNGKWSGELRQVRENGSTFTAQVSIMQRCDPLGAPLGFTMISQDFRQAHRILDQLKESHEYNRGLIESNIDALVVTDACGVITDVNLQMCAVTGLERTELVGTPCKDYFTDPKRAADGVRLVLAQGQVTNYELTIRARDGKETMVSYSAMTYRGEDGRPRGVFAAANDLTARKLMEEQIRNQNDKLAETAEFLNNVLESSTGYSIIAMDLEGNVLAWNEGARRNYGYTAEEVVGKKDSRLLHTAADIQSGRVAALFETATRTGKAEGVFERIRKNGKPFTAAVSITLRRDVVGSPIGFVLISKDITDQKRLEEQLRRKNEELEAQNSRVQEASRLKSEFLANMSHELRTPLNSIIGFSELIHDSKVGKVTARQKEYVGDVLTSARHLLQLINDVLDLSKVESGKMEFFPELIDPTELVRETRDIMRTLVARKRLHLQVEIDSSLKPIVLDPGKLKQVLFNFLSNAIKFTPEEGHMTIAMRSDGLDDFIVEVRDTGIGIEPDDIERLFVEFQQLDASASKKYQGTGLGLALTRRIVEAQGGEVGVTSVPGEGSVFFARLPRMQPRAPMSGGGPAMLVPRALEAGRRVVLVIEDNGSDRSFLIETLERAGYAVEAAATGADALRMLVARHYDVITLDLMLPDMSGWDILRRIRESDTNREVPVVIASVLADQGIGVGFSIHDFIEKPIDSARLLETLDRAGVTPRERSRVLLVDDDEQALKLYEVAVRDAGFATVACTSAEAALGAVAKQVPDLVVLDLIMPDIDGFEFLRRFRAMKGARTTPVIVLTAKEPARDELEALNATARTVVRKGAGSVEALLTEVKAALAVGDCAAANPVTAPGALMSERAGGGSAPHVLVVDDDVNTFKLLEPVIREWGYKTIFAKGGAIALGMLEKESPVALILDLVMPAMGGLEFLNRLRADKRYRDLPVIVMTAKDIGSEEAGEIEALANFIVRKGAGGSLDLLEALHDCAPVPAAIRKVA